MKVLFLINDFGNGNIIRNRPIIKFLSRENEIVLFSSKKRMEFIPEHQNIKRYVKRFQYSYSFSLYNFLKYLTNCFMVLNIILKEKPNKIIIDSDYHLLPIKVFIKAEVISINNSLYTVRNNKSLSFSYILELVDYYFQKIIPNLVIVPSLKETNEVCGKFHCIPLWSDVVESKKLKQGILFIEGGSCFQYEMDEIVNEFSKLDNTFSVIGINDLGKIKNCNFSIVKTSLQAEIDKASLVIIRGGQSSIADARNSNLPIIIIPIKGHHEQETNALMATKHYGFSIANDLVECVHLIREHKVGPPINSRRTIDNMNFIVETILK